MFKDHPRIRGEHVNRAMISDVFPGSSPHPRGTQDGALAAAGTKGIIPASAGNTSLLSPPILTIWDHPRIRGEHTKKIP